MDANDIKELRDLLSRATQGEWYPGHLVNDEHSCNCRHILSEGYLGGIATVEVGNGQPLYDGGNDSPPLEEAKANLALIAKMKNCLDDLLTIAENNPPAQNYKIAMQERPAHINGVKIETGLYRIYWADGGCSLAAIGLCSNGSWWVTYQLGCARRSASRSRRPRRQD